MRRFAGDAAPGPVAGFWGADDGHPVRITVQITAIKLHERVYFFN
ncbi:MAG TPA: hypothetical protein VMZ05_01770 [Spirochaetota bacterium]|nr:hypothetical protein [Spirochaetota bacterium]